jgi:hypothetical protein
MMNRSLGQKKTFLLLLVLLEGIEQISGVHMFRMQYLPNNSYIASVQFFCVLRFSPFLKPVLIYAESAC